MIKMPRVPEDKNPICSIIISKAKKEKQAESVRFCLFNQPMNFPPKFLTIFRNNYNYTL